MLTHNTSGLQYNYVVNNSTNTQTIPIDQLPHGTYIVNLIANGEVLDAKQLIIN